MNNENYITIQGWMINELRLKGNKLILFAIIYGFSQDGNSEYFGSLSYIQNALKISRPTAISLLKRLINENLIERVSESKYRVVKKLYHQNPDTSKETLLAGSKETLPNKYNTNNSSSIVSSDNKKSKKEEWDFYSFKPLEEIAEWYLNNKRIIKSLLSQNRANLSDEKKIKDRMYQFVEYLQSTGLFQQTTREFTSHFLSWNEKAPKKPPKQQKTINPYDKLKKDL